MKKTLIALAITIFSTGTMAQSIDHNQTYNNDMNGPCETHYAHNHHMDDDGTYHQHHHNHNMAENGTHHEHHRNHNMGENDNHHHHNHNGNHDCSSRARYDS